MGARGAQGKRECSEVGDSRDLRLAVFDDAKDAEETLSRERPMVLWAVADPEAVLPPSVASLFELVRVTGPGTLVARARELKPDLLLLERKPTDFAGRELLELLQEPPASSPPVLVLAQEYDDAEAVRFLDLGVADYVSREISSGELRARMDKAIREGQHRRELSELARTDALTGLANYRALVARIGEEFSRAERYEHPLSAVMIDLDHLKDINDRYGHDAGNRAICALTRSLRAGLRQTDFAARYGGDEFVILLPYQTSTEALRMVERLRRAVSKLQIFDAEGEPLDLELTFSAGIAGHTPETPIQSGEALLQLADAALYQAKRSGRNRVVVLEPREATTETRA